MTTGPLLEPEDRVLSTMNRDGSRRWLRPRPSPGAFLTWRRVVAYTLIPFFVLLPWIRINGKPAVLIDLAAREFTFFGTTFLPTDTVLLMLFVASVFVTIFFVTALLGRVWCGWACPQTVYMEFLYRPIERFFDGPPDARGRANRPATGFRKIMKYLAFLAASLILAHIFLAYFVGVDQLFQWMRQSPLEHPKSFLVVMFVTAAMMFDFGFFREQVCILCCPYGRFQSVMLDRNSMIISYDEERGEPRGKARRRTTTDGDVALRVVGDCVDCSKCVTTCPTGIDIREGLQLECIGCAQCIDACNSVMEKLGRPKGLIRYSSQARMQGNSSRLIRTRVIIYPLILAVLVSAFIFKLANQSPMDVTLLPGQRRPYVMLENGDVQNEVRLKLVNRTDDRRRYEVRLTGIDGARLERVDTPMEEGIEPRGTVETHFRVITPPEIFRMGRASAELVITDETGFERTMTYRMQGPFSARRTGPDEVPDDDAKGDSNAGNDR